MAYDGCRRVSNYRTLEEMPVFAKAGAIIPLAVPDTWNSIENPAHLELQVFPGAAGSFRLYEDDGRTSAYEQGASVTTDIAWSWGRDAELVIEAPRGDLSLIPAHRHYTVVFRATSAAGVEADVPCTITRTGRDIRVICSACDGPVTIRLTGCSVVPNPVQEAAYAILDSAYWSNNGKASVMQWIERGLPLAALLSTLDNMEMPDHLRKALVEVLTAKA